LPLLADLHSAFATQFRERIRSYGRASISQKIWPPSPPQLHFFTDTQRHIASKRPFSNPCQSTGNRHFQRFNPHLLSRAHLDAKQVPSSVGKYFPSTWQFPVTTNPSFRITGIPLFPAVLAVAVAVAVAYLACHPEGHLLLPLPFLPVIPKGWPSPPHTLLSSSPKKPIPIFPTKTNVKSRSVLTQSPSTTSRLQKSFVQFVTIEVTNTKSPDFGRGFCISFITILE
jgi:hypothetical protein